MSSEIRTFLEVLAAETKRSRIVAAAESLLHSDARLDGAPPAQFVAALIESDAATDQSFLNLARAWSRPEMSRAMLDKLPIASTPQQKEQVAWLLKTVLAAEHSQEAVDRILDKNEDPQVCRWLLEGLERMTFAGPLGWNELDRVVSYLIGQSDRILEWDWRRYWPRCLGTRRMCRFSSRFFLTKTGKLSPPPRTRWQVTRTR